MECIICKDKIENGGNYGCGCTSRIHVHCMVKYYQSNRDFRCPCCRNGLSHEFIENIIKYRNIWKDIISCKNVFYLPYLYIKLIISKIYIAKDDHFIDFIS